MSGVRLSDPRYAVSVVAPARLHMGFIDLGGSLGRKFGSIGVGINEIATRLSICGDTALNADGPCHERACKIARQFDEALGVSSRVAIRIHQAIPEHVGLGSGTQLALAVGMGLARFHGLGLGVREVASAIKRGARSGIGIGVFEQGGLIVDGGRGPETSTPPIISRLAFPSHWRLVLVLDRRGQGLHGKLELEAFKQLPVFPAEETARLCHLLMMQALPALAEGDVRGFGAVVSDLQNAVGDHFAPAQGGRFTSPEVAEAMAWLESQGAVGMGQTSWGPTGFCLFDDAPRAETLAATGNGRFQGLQFLSATARNQGAEILPADWSPMIEVLRT